MFNEPGTTDNVGWAFMFGITAILGSWGSGTLGQSDWTRYAKRRFAPTLSQLLAAPLMISVTATIGIIVTSASKDILGEIVWNPIYLLGDIQDHYHSSPRSRAGVFFASLGLVSSQLAVGFSPQTVTKSTRIVLMITDLRRVELSVSWNGLGWSLSQIHQYHPRELPDGYNWHCHTTMATYQHRRQVPHSPQWIRCFHGPSYVSYSS